MENQFTKFYEFNLLYSTQRNFGLFLMKSKNKKTWAVPKCTVKLVINKYK
jgi:hypothetical protein